MSMNVQSMAAYSVFQSNYNSAEVKGKKEAQIAEKTAAAKDIESSGEKNLSKDAEKLLKKLKASHSDMDFMVADFEKGDDAKELLSRGTKEFSVLFSSEELEKMAADEDYYNEKMKALDGAVRMSKEINDKYGFEASGKDSLLGGAEMTKFGVSFNSDGTTTYFAELEKSSDMQKKRIEKAQEQKAEEKQDAKRKEQSQASDTKRVTVQASTKEELFEKMEAINWDSVKADTQTVGSRFDYSV